ncbi:MAG: hypothetical protein L6262_03100 [Weeksellaceae bacterium]|nr:hypothetical protein [Weeksellaceae bacterium]
MKKVILFLIFLISIATYSQVSVFEARRTTDRAVVEKFIRDNPQHPAVPELQKRLPSLSYGSKSSSVAKPTISPMTEKKIEKTSAVGTSAAKGEPSEQAKNTAAMLTNILNGASNKNQAVIQFVNKSKCILVIKISGKKFYNLTVPANNQNSIMVEKGSYDISTSICDAIYNQTKALNGNLIITLNSAKK